MQDYNEDIVIEQLQNPATVRQAFARVVARYSEPLYWQIRKMVLSHDDANDLLQNTFLKAWGSIEYFRGDAKLSTWLYRIAVNEALTFLARERERRNLTADDTDDFLLSHVESDEYFDGDRAQRLLQEAVLQLPEKQRLVFNMRYFDEMKYEDMSEILGTSVGALKASVSPCGEKNRGISARSCLNLFIIFVSNKQKVKLWKRKLPC